MHETAIVRGLMRILEQKAAESGIRRIVSVRLKVGRLRGLESRQLRGCFALFAEDTLAEGAQLIIEEVPVQAHCPACDRSWVAAAYRLQCPGCGGTEAEIQTGRELYIESFEGERACPKDRTPAGASPFGRRHRITTL
ncbi:Hydrogenase maturation factor HypA 2 [Rhodovastum atsumiense]|uniref:Hydrogenase maturation factor HypA n=2 Tax=Rhodovastum atsumiense TaxID=504468 RepID=A0A5M6IXU1_9PROT|nr:hydrogenase maturation nickel metallochaperone HypA [Rhodovastum atsumiense]CAH2603854.1 Hydrogenase maturation factor HypA 2 [Rhodovastum atsumiense]